MLFNKEMIQEYCKYTGADESEMIEYYNYLADRVFEVTLSGDKLLAVLHGLRTVVKEALEQEDEEVALLAADTIDMIERTVQRSQ